MPLTRKTPLKSTGWNKKKTSDKKSKVKTLGQLKKDADKYFSLYIRYRDGRYTHANGWESQCITCDRWKPLKQMQAGHFITRVINELRFSDENVNSQCYRCNVKRYGEQYLYAKALDIKYGEGTAERLAARRVLVHNFTRNEFEQIITDAKTCVAYYQQNEVGMNDKPKPTKVSDSEVETKRPFNTAITNPDEPANKKYRRRKITIIQK